MKRRGSLSAGGTIRVDIDGLRSDMITSPDRQIILLIWSRQLPDRKKRQAKGAVLNEREPIAPEPNIVFMLELPVKAMDAAIYPLLAASGHGDIRPAHAKVFESVAESGSRITDMASAVSLTKQAMQYLIDDLEALGYVERFADAADRRAKLVRLTATGREVLKLATESMAATEDAWRQRMGAEDMDELRRLLTRLVATVSDS
jgi:DNA-binding MarR family transcriptional regulator